MAKEFYDAVGEKKKEITNRWKPVYKKARKASDEGKLKLVREQICQPWDGYGFTLDKGQVIRWELIAGPQILDTVYLVRSRPTEEWADAWLTDQLHGGDARTRNRVKTADLLTSWE